MHFVGSYWTIPLQCSTAHKHKNVTCSFGGEHFVAMCVWGLSPKWLVGVGGRTSWLGWGGGSRSGDVWWPPWLGAAWGARLESKACSLFQPRSSPYDLETALKSSVRIERYGTVEGGTLRGTHLASIGTRLASIGTHLASIRQTSRICWTGEETLFDVGTARNMWIHSWRQVFFTKRGNLHIGHRHLKRRFAAALSTLVIKIFFATQIKSAKRDQEQQNLKMRAKDVYCDIKSNLTIPDRASPCIAVYRRVSPCIAVYRRVSPCIAVYCRV
jgi:hypothetical protein